VVPFSGHGVVLSVALFQYSARDWLGRLSSKLLTMSRVRRKTLPQSLLSCRPIAPRYKKPVKPVLQLMSLLLVLRPALVENDSCLKPWFHV